MATVITNLLSAIPWIGQSLVESQNITETVLLTASLLPTIGTVSAHALKKGNKNLRLDKKEYLSIPPSFLGFFAGIIDGDGYIQITRTTKGFITIKLVISIHLEDISTLEYIQSVLKLGKLTVYKDLQSPTCKLIINRTDLQEIIFPLFLHHGIFFLTETRRAQFDLCMFILKNEIKDYDKITRSRWFELPRTAEEYKNLAFFKNWFVGFTMSEGSFFVKTNNEGCFQLKQRVHVLLFEAFKLVFETSRTPINKKSKSAFETEKGLYSQFSVSSKADIQRVINFFSFSGYHPLIGLKGIQYLKWLTVLRNTKRYANLNFPQ